MEGTSYGRWKLELLEMMSRTVLGQTKGRRKWVEIAPAGELAASLVLLGHPLQGRRRWADLRRTWRQAMRTLADDNELMIHRRLKDGRKVQLQRLLAGALLELAALHD